MSSTWFTSFTMYNFLLVLLPVYSIVKFSCSGHLQFNFKVSARVTVLLNRKGDLKMVLNQICPSVSCNHRLTTRFILLNLRQSLHDRWFGTVLSSGCRTHPHSVWVPKEPFFPPKEMRGWWLKCMRTLHLRGLYFFINGYYSLLRVNDPIGKK